MWRRNVWSNSLWFIFHNNNKKNRGKLQKILGEDFPLDENHDKIIQKLACFTKIRNKIEITIIDLLNLFNK